MAAASSRDGNGAQALKAEPPELNDIAADVCVSSCPSQGTPLTCGQEKAFRHRSFIAICSSCAQLDVRVDKFCVNGPFARPARSAAKSKGSSILKTSSKRIMLGSLSEMRARTHCPICTLVWRSTTNSEGPPLYLDESECEAIKCFANWEIDGREVILDPCGRISEHKNLTRRIHLRWNTDKIQDAYLIYVTPTYSSRPNSDAPRSWGSEHLFLGRELEAMGKNQALINSWLEACDEQHGERCCISHDEKYYELIQKSYFGVVDVQDMRLTSLPYDERYVALSYVWGKDQCFRTLLSNVLLHRAHGGLESQTEHLPRAILDAIEVCRKLGIRYLWVDSLCIVQDSVRSWKLNAAAMDTIYGNAHITIAAADGIDADAGLRAMHSKPTDSKYQEQHIIECAPGLRLTISRLAEAGIQKSVWNTRAWTFCERLLSKRCLIFTQGRVYFQCRSTAMSEDIVAEPKGAGWSLGLIDAPLQLLRELKPDRRPFWVYMNCVSLYTKRHLTYANDVLAAFGGISNLLSDKLQCTMIFGLPSSHFDLALLFSPSGPMLRRVPKDGDEKKKWGTDEFPTWSWCGWIDDPTDSISTEMYYDTAMLEGCLQNVNEWLTQRTWIHWYIRDGHGDLRPVWWPGEPYSHNRDHDSSSSSTSVERAVLIEDDFARHRRNTEDEYEYTRRNDRAQQDQPSRERIIIGRRQRSSTSFDVNEREEKARAEHRERKAKLEALEREIRNTRKDTEYYDEYPHSGNAARRTRHRAYEPKTIKLNRFQIPSGVNRWEGYSTYAGGIYHDGYGRQLNDDIVNKPRDYFHRTVPEHPFGVKVARKMYEPSVEFPDQRYLQFYTYAAYLRLSLHEGRSTSKVRGLARYDISDDGGDWCGTIVLDERWAAMNVSSERPFEFLAVSKAKNFTKDENDVWTFYIPKEQHQTDWDLYFVLLVERGSAGIARRVGLGKVFEAAFDNACYPGKEWKEIIME